MSLLSLRLRSLSIAFLFASLAVAPVARADEASPEQPPKKSEARWYGWQTLTADAASVGLFALSASSDSRAATQAFSYAGLGTYGLGAPIVHAAHGHFGKALGSLGLRIGVPFVGLLIGGVVGGLVAPDDSVDPLAFRELASVVQGMQIGGAIGVIGASVLDAAVLARDTVEVASPQSRPSQARPTLSPTFAVAPNRADVGLTGTF